MLRFPVPNTLVSQKLGQASLDLRARLEQTSVEAVTGRRENLVQHLDGQIGDALLAEKAVADLTAERDQLSLRESRLSIVQTSLSAVSDRVQSLSTRTLSELSSGNAFSRQRVFADAGVALDEVFSALNVRLGQRFLFAGDATSTQPFNNADQLISDIRDIGASAATPEAFEAALDTYFEDPNSPWQQSIYRGTATAFDPEAVTGGSEALTGIIRNIAVIAAAEGETGAFQANTDAILSRSASALGQAEANLVNLRADLGLQQSRLSQRSDALDLEETVLTEVLNGLTARDQFEAASELRQLQANLEASFLLTNRLSNLTLTNFLR